MRNSPGSRRDSDRWWRGGRSGWGTVPLASAGGKGPAGCGRTHNHQNGDNFAVAATAFGQGCSFIRLVNQSPCCQAPIRGRDQDLQPSWDVVGSEIPADGSAIDIGHHAEVLRPISECTAGPGQGNVEGHNGARNWLVVLVFNTHHRILGDVFPKPVYCAFTRHDD